MFKYIIKGFEEMMNSIEKGFNETMNVSYPEVERNELDKTFDQRWVRGNSDAFFFLF